VAAVQTLYSPTATVKVLLRGIRTSTTTHSLYRVSHERQRCSQPGAPQCGVRSSLVLVVSMVHSGAHGEKTRALGYAIVDSGGSIIMDRSLQVFIWRNNMLLRFHQTPAENAKAQAKSGWRAGKTKAAGQVHQRCATYWAPSSQQLGGTLHRLSLCGVGYSHSFARHRAFPLPALLILPAALCMPLGFFGFMPGGGSGWRVFRDFA
jgi:hypothetical protein